MNELTIEEFDALSPDTYVLYDIRSTDEINHGAIKGAIASSAEELEENPPEEKDKKIIICCSRGRVSRDVAEALCEQGFDAVSLKGGYIAWLMAEIKKQEADEICDSVERACARNSTRTFSANSRKPSTSMSWSKRATALRSAFPAAKIPC